MATYGMRCMNFNVKRLTFLHQNIKCCWLSSHIERSESEPFTLCTHSDSRVIEISLFNEVVKKLNINAFLSRFYNKKQQSSTPFTIELGLPIAEHVNAGYAYLHWGNVDTHRTQCCINESATTNNIICSPSPTNNAACSIAKTLQNYEITDWLTDIDQSTLNDCSSFYATTTHDIRAEKYKNLIDDTHFDGTNIDVRNADDIILRDIDEYKVRVENNVLDSSVDDCGKSAPSYVLKNSLEHVNPEDLDAIVKSDRKISDDEVLKSASVLIGDVCDLNHVLQFCSKSDTDQAPDKGNDPSRPSREQVLEIKEFLLQEIPRFFHRAKDLRKYHKNIIFENNFFAKPRITHGISKYVGSMIKIRVLAHIQYASLGVKILSATTHEDEGLVKIRWQVLALSQLQVYKFWNFLPHNFTKNRSALSKKFDGISTFTVGPDGLIHKHRVDRVIPDENFATSKKVKISPAVAV